MTNENINETEEPMDNERLITPEEIKMLDDLLNAPLWDNDDLRKSGRNFSEDE